MLLGSLSTALRREREIGATSEVKTSEEAKKDPRVIVINTKSDKSKDKINKIETIKRRKIGKNQKPSELLKYYDYLTYENPKLIAKNMEKKEGDLVSSIKKAFEEKPKESGKIEVKSSTFEDPFVKERLRSELIDTETKLRTEKRLIDEMERKAKIEVEKAKLEAKKAKEEAEKAKEEAKAKVKEEAKAKLKEIGKAKEKPSSIFKELDFPEASKPKSRKSDKVTKDIGDSMSLTTKSKRGRPPKLGKDF